MNRIALSAAGVLTAFLVFAVSPYSAQANHAWGNYHWARTANPFTLKLGDNVSGSWDSYLSTASADWSGSSVLDTTVVAGAANPKNCRPTAGRVEVCNATYGNNGWLGIAQIWVSGANITQGAVKLNDTYYNTTKYNRPAWRQFVMCQEIGHTFGLNHQDENFTNANLNTCMDYTSDPSSNDQPNAHDYDELGIIYAHLDSTTTVGNGPSRAPAASDLDSPGEWGRLVDKSADGKAATFERDLGHGQKVLTHVYYAD
jgi:hypothetical protein